MNQISAPRSLYLCYATALLIFGFLTVPASSAPIDANQTLDSSCLNSPSVPFVDLNIQVTDRTGALVGRAEFEVRCGRQL
jgi:hypothetical protein